MLVTQFAIDYFACNIYLKDDGNSYYKLNFIRDIELNVFYIYLLMTSISYGNLDSFHLLSSSGLSFIRSKGLNAIDPTILTDVKKTIRSLRV